MKHVSVNELLIEMSVYVYLREMSVTNKDGEKKYYMSKNLNQTPNLNVALLSVWW